MLTASRRITPIVTYRTKSPILWPVNVRTSFRANLLKLLEQRGLKRAKFARAIGMDPSQFYRILRGQENLSEKWLPKIIDALGIHPADLYAAHEELVPVVKEAPLNQAARAVDREALKRAIRELNKAVAKAQEHLTKVNGQQGNSRAQYAAASKRTGNRRKKRRG